jgi:hypothetical protein
VQIEVTAAIAGGAPVMRTRSVGVVEPGGGNSEPVAGPPAVLDALTVPRTGARGVPGEPAYAGPLQRAGEGAPGLRQRALTHVPFVGCDHHEQALVISRETGDRRGEDGALGNLGNAYAALGETRRAIEHYEQSLAIGHAISDPRIIQACEEGLSRCREPGESTA